jgi:YHS domain-containing protein
MLVRDPVCESEVFSENTKYITEYNGQFYYFESRQCQAMFEQNPEGYATPIPDRVHDIHGDRIDGSE